MDEFGMNAAQVAMLARSAGACVSRFGKALIGYRRFETKAPATARHQQHPFCQCELNVFTMFSRSHHPCYVLREFSNYIMYYL